MLYVVKQHFLKMLYVWMVHLLLASSLYALASAEAIFEEAIDVKPGGHVTTEERKIVSLQNSAGVLFSFSYCSAACTTHILHVLW